MTSSPSPATVVPAGGVGRRARALPLVMMLASCLSVQFGSAVATQLFPLAGPLGTTALRLGLGAIVMLAVVRPRVGALRAEQWRAVIGFGLVLGAMNGCFYSALDRIPLGTAVALEFLGPLTVSAVLSRRPRDLARVLLALRGVGLFGAESMLGADALDPVGVLLALVAGACWGGYVLLSARVGQLLPGQDGLALALVVAAALLLPLGAPGAVQALAHPLAWVLALGTALLASVVPYSLELSALRRLPRHVFGILLSLEPAIALGVGVLVLAQQASPWKVLAAALVVAASVGVTLTARDRTPVEPDPLTGELPVVPDLPIPANATLTGEMPVLDAALRDGLEEPPSPGHGRR